MDTVTLLWRRHIPQPARRGRPPRLTVDDVVCAGIAVADEHADPGFGLREVADRAGVPVMTLYSTIASREQLLELMVDQCRAEGQRDPLRGGWRQRLRQVAADNLALFESHPWLAHVESERAVLGPGTLAKYERELAAVEPLPLSDAAKDAALTVVLDFVRASSRSLQAARLERASETPQEWWEREGAQLATLDIESRFPLAARIGTAAGQAQGAATNTGKAYEFGLTVLLDGIARQGRT